MNIVDILHRCDLFSAVPPAQFQRLATMARLCQFRKGQVVFQENDPCPGVFLVGQGLVRLFEKGPAGREHVLHMVGPGGSFAEVAAMGNFPVPASAEAVKKTACAPPAPGTLSGCVGRRPRTLPRHADRHDDLGAAFGDPTGGRHAS